MIPIRYQRDFTFSLSIHGFDDYGHVELNVKDDGSQSPDHCDHSISIEPEFVEYVT